MEKKYENKLDESGHDAGIANKQKSSYTVHGQVCCNWHTIVNTRPVCGQTDHSWHRVLRGRSDLGERRDSRSR